MESEFAVHVQEMATYYIECDCGACTLHHITKAWAIEDAQELGFVVVDEVVLCRDCQRREQ